MFLRVEQLFWSVCKTSNACNEMVLPFLGVASKFSGSKPGIISGFECRRGAFFVFVAGQRLVFEDQASGVLAGWLDGVGWTRCFDLRRVAKKGKLWVGYKKFLSLTFYLIAGFNPCPLSWATDPAAFMAMQILHDLLLPVPHLSNYGAEMPAYRCGFCQYH